MAEAWMRTRVDTEDPDTYIPFIVEAVKMGHYDHPTGGTTQVQPSPGRMVCIAKVTGPRDEEDETDA